MAEENDPVWRPGQRIKVTCPRCRHFGRYAVITQVYNVRLGVAFEDGEPGSFVDKSRASLVVGPLRAARALRQPAVAARQPAVDVNMATFSADDGVTELSHLLEHLAFTPATLISSTADDPDLNQRTLDSFQVSVRDNARRMGNQQRNNPHN
jgi:hypothetical protein